MTARTIRTLVADGTLPLAACRADHAPRPAREPGPAAASGMDPGGVALSQYTDVTPPGVLCAGLAVRVAPDGGRMAAIALGGRALVAPSGLLPPETAWLFDLGGEPVHLGLLAPDKALDVEILAPAAGDGRVTVWSLSIPGALPLPRLPEGVDLASPLLLAAEAAEAAGGFGELVAVGLVIRFAACRAEDIVRGVDRLGPWVGDRLGQAADRAQETARLASAAAVGWAHGWRRLDETLDPESGAWMGELLETLRLRDDLASAARVLRRLGLAGELDAVLAQADAGAAEWLRALPFAMALRDEHLAEVARVENPFWARRRWFGLP